MRANQIKLITKYSPATSTFNKQKKNNMKPGVSFVICKKDE